MDALVLAAGYATRLYPLTKDRPKPLLTIGEKTILGYLIEQFLRIDECHNIYVVTNDRFYRHFVQWAEEQQHKPSVGSRQMKIINDGTSSNETRLGAIADIRLVIEKEHLQDDLLVTGGDNIFRFDLRELVAAFHRENCDVVVAHHIDDLEKLRRSGVIKIDAAGNAIGFTEKPAEPESSLICPALYIYRKETLPDFKTYLEEKYNPDAPGHFIPWLMNRNRVFAYQMQESYYDIGDLASYRAVCKEFERM
jgi:glucose-1-phosphate thymidylyltransferase